MDDVDYKVVDTPSEAYAAGENHTLSSPVKARFFRIDSLNGNCGYEIAFKKIYFFGSITTSKSRGCTCIHKRTINYNLLRFIVMFCS